MRLLGNTSVLWRAELISVEQGYFPMLCGSLKECALSVTMERQTEILTIAGQINAQWMGL